MNVAFASMTNLYLSMCVSQYVLYDAIPPSLHLVYCIFNSFQKELLLSVENRLHRKAFICLS